MGQENQAPLTIEKLAQNLTTFAVDRTDLKNLLAAIPENHNLNITTIEYELQILKILSAGWAISFYVPAENKNKGTLTQIFWDCIREISKNISELTQTTTSQNIDYFEILKERLNTYLEIMQKNPDASQNPANVMGPAFASICKSEDDAIAVLTGTKMFTLTLGAVKEYLDAITIDDIKLN
jgi:hypothetical protein